MKRTWALVAAVLAAAAPLARGTQITLPVYLEDNHAGSFYWLAQHLDLEEPCTLLHFDAHSDASAIFDSDVIRARLRRVDSTAERARILADWRKQGAVQCFNWIEPLLPAPIADVIWIPREHLDPEAAKKLADNAADLLDSQLEAAPRAAGKFRPRLHVTGRDALDAAIPTGRAIVATIDLDYFADIPPNECAEAFERVWSSVTELRDLRAITIAISRPFLHSDEQADQLVQMALRAALSLPTATIQFEPFQMVANDQSTRAKELRKQGLDVPSFDLVKASPALRALLLRAGDRIAVLDESARYQQLLHDWR
ncbi:MAG: hypothetical protein ABI992_08105, partial [Chthoniobacterales bacterium]